MLTLTVDGVLALKPCKKYTREYVTELFSGKESVTLIEAMKEAKLPIIDKLWLGVHFLNAKGYTSVVQNFAIYCAEDALPIFEKAYPEDKRPRLAIQAARDYINGLISLDTLKEARSADAAAAYAAADADADAAYAAAAARNSARVEKQQELLNKLVELIQNI